MLLNNTEIESEFISDRDILRKQLKLLSEKSENFTSMDPGDFALISSQMVSIYLALYSD